MYLHLYIYINIIYIINKYIYYINITYFSEILTCMCVYLYIDNKYTQYILCQQNLLFWMQLIIWQH